MGKMSPAIPLSVIIFLILDLPICCVARNSSFACIARERNALLRFRASLEDPSNRLSSWNPKNDDCCRWQGVECNEISGHVISLDLSNKIYGDYVYLEGNSPDYSESDYTTTYGFLSRHYLNSSTIYATMLHGKTLNSSLFELKYLTYLDLSWNDFQFSEIPAFLGSMKHLEHLNFSNSNFSGPVPDHLGNLSSLRALDLSCGYSFHGTGITFEGQTLKVDDLRWAINLSSLEYLDMSFVNLSSTKDPFEALNMLPSLRMLRLCSCELSQHLPHACINSNPTFFAEVWHLDLSWNFLGGGFPCFIQNMTRLSFLDLSWNTLNFSGTFHFLGLKNLAHLNLAGNSLANEVEWISNILQDKCHLKSFDLSRNNLDSDISRFFTNLSGCWSDNLESLSLWENNFYGHIPLWLGNLRSLRVLKLQRNRLSGPIPISLGQLSNLEDIDISFNSFNGTFSEAHFAKLSKLEYLRAESNMLRFGVGYDWMPPFQLKYLNMRSSKFGGQFPKWLQTQKALIYLDLSNCGIIGTLPKRFDSINMTYVDLSNNSVMGPIPQLASTMTFLDLSNNMITHDLPKNIGDMMPLLHILVLARNSIMGRIPDSLCELRNLDTLDLSKNHLSGNLPDCWSNFQILRVARFSFNNLSGVIPNSIGGARILQWFHLNDNKIVGQLPSTLKNCTSLTVLDVGGNSLSGELPEWIGKALPQLMVLILSNNEFKGTIPSAFCQLLKLQVMDLANNKLTGNIPHCFGNLSGMTQIDWNTYFWEWDYESLSQVIKGKELEYTTNSRFVVNLDLSSNYLVGEIPSELTSLSCLIGLNLSHNHLGGEIPAKIGDLELLQSLDLSNNKLSGKIPDGLSNLNFLSHLNFSNNNLSGQIPTGNQLQTLEDRSIYEGNPQLCGSPLLKKCANVEPPSAGRHETGKEDTSYKALFYAFIVAGFATGFWGLIGVLVIKIKWRQAYFRLIEVVAEKMIGY